MKILVIMAVMFVSLLGQAMMFVRRYDFEVWNMETESRVCIADGVNGLREWPFQYDYRSRCLYSIQGQYDGNSVMRVYDLSKGSVSVLPIPAVSRATDHWSCAVVGDFFYIIGVGESPRECMYKGHGNVLFGSSLDSPVTNHFVKLKDFGADRICLKLRSLDEDTLCVLGFEIVTRRYFVECLDGKTLRLKNKLFFPQEWTSDHIAALCKSKASFRQLELTIGVPFAVRFSPMGDKILLHRESGVKIFNSHLDSLCEFDFNESVFSKYANKNVHVEWVNDNVLVVFDPINGDWAEYDVDKRSICAEGRIPLRKKFWSSDWEELVMHTVGHGKFFLLGRDSCLHDVERRICIQQRGGGYRDFYDAVAGWVYYFAPDVVVFERL